MAKTKLDWFKLDCHLDDKVELIEAEFGLEGFAIVIKILQKIYGAEGYYCQWNRDSALLFAKKTGSEREFVEKVIDSCIERGVFDSEMYARYGILTSHGIQKRYYDCADRRKRMTIRQDYLLLSEDEYKVKPENNDDISKENVDILKENADISSTEKKRREEKRKEETRSEEKREEKTSQLQPSAPPLSTFGSHMNIFLTEREHDQLISDYGKENVERYIEKMSLWAADKCRKLDNCAFRLREWLEKDGYKKSTFDVSKYEFLINNF